MKNFFEHQAVNARIIAERTTDKGKELDIEVKFQQADEINANKRLYSRALLNRELKKISQKIERGASIWAHSFHPSDGVGRPQDIAGRWNKVWMENDGSCYGQMTILPTTAGQTMRVLVQAGRIGISSRGFGKTTEREEKGKKYLEVTDYQMVSPGDFVVAPSVQGAYASVNEELNELARKLDEEEERKMKKEPEKEQKKVTSAQVFAEARVLGISAVEYAKILNEHEERKSLDKEDRILFVEAEYASRMRKEGQALMVSDIQEKIVLDDEGFPKKVFEVRKESPQEMVKRIKKEIAENKAEVNVSDTNAGLLNPIHDKKARLVYEKMQAGGYKKSMLKE